MSHTVSRKLGDSELSYYLPSREDGVSDMYLRLSVRIHKDIFTPERLHIAWSILQIRNPLLAARIESNYDTTFRTPLPGSDDPKKHTPLSANFVYDIPQNSSDAIKRVKKHVGIVTHPTQPIREFLATYLDGPRTLSDEIVCKLLLVHAHPEDAEGPQYFPIPTPEERAAKNPYNPHPKPDKAAHLILLCAHFIGDAGSIQFISKDLMYLLSFPTDELERVLEREVQDVCAAVEASGGVSENGSDFKGSATLLPASLEGRLPPIRGRFRNVLSKMEFMKWQSRMIGGHCFEKKAAPNPLSFLMASKPSTPASESASVSTSTPTTATGLLTPPSTNAPTTSNEQIRSFPFSISAPASVSASASLAGSINSSSTRTSPPASESGKSEASTAPSSVPSSPVEKAEGSVIPTVVPEQTQSVVPSQPRRRIPTHTRTHELILSKERTAQILARCKKEGVTISTALFAVVGAAWGEMQASKVSPIPSGSTSAAAAATPNANTLPILLYSARNMRPYLPPKAPKALSGGGLKEGKGYKGWESYYYLSLSYFNVILPVWLPDASSSSDLQISTPSALAQKVFWHRARLSRKQARGPNVEDIMDIMRFVSRTWQMGRARREGAEGFAIGVLRKVREMEEGKRAAAVRARGVVLTQGQEVEGASASASKDVPVVAITPTAAAGTSTNLTATTLQAPINARLSGLRPSMPMRMPSQMAVPQEFPPSPPITPGNTNAPNTPAISRNASSIALNEGKLSIPGPAAAKLDLNEASNANKEKEVDAAKAHRNPLSAQFLPPKVPTTALLGLSLLGSFDPLFPPPNQKIDHLYPSTPSSSSETDSNPNIKPPASYDPESYAPFEPISLGAGCRLKPGGSLLYAYTYDAQLTIVLGYDTGPMGLVNDVEGKDGIEALWKGIVSGIGKWLEEGKMDPKDIEAGQKITVSG